MKDYRKGFTTIPKSIKYNNDLSLLERMIFSDILNYDDIGECFASNKHFSLLYDVDISSVERVFKSLKSKGYITTKYNRKAHKRVTKITDKWHNELSIQSHTIKDIEKQVKLNETSNSKMVDISELKKIWS